MATRPRREVDGNVSPAGNRSPLRPVKADARARLPESEEDNFGNSAGGPAPVVSVPVEDVEDLEVSSDEVVDSSDEAPHLEDAYLNVKVGKSLVRKLSEYAGYEGLTKEELAAEILSEGLVLRAWEIVEKKATMRGPNQQNFNRQNNGNVNGNVAGGNQSPGHNQGHNQQNRFQGGNKMAQKKLQRQARQHANAMDLMSDKAAFLEYVRNQEKKRRS
jgi:hypothetical protein